ncbi:hypothetical protein VNO77_39368 [Canavalia gladiata]|uniref:TIR domain-containing protein n=1 Tax=Canavalia gladiata TaxID=3824 RepID=A0AAN9KD00_CANGL
MKCSDSLGVWQLQFSSSQVMIKQAAPSLCSFTCEWTYDVFLSFRGEDTRHGFTGNLYNSLRQRGIHAFIDDEGLRRGEEITPALLKAIQESRIAIVVFSKNYASSAYCLDELVKILECLKMGGRLFWPVFYDVEPSLVRCQTGTYGEALAKREERFQDDNSKVQKWRKALHEAANLSGWHFQQGYELEYKFINKIVDEASKKINRTIVHVADHPVGLESSVVEVMSLLGFGSDVNMVGIYGIGGIGKTTIARAAYNMIADQFEGLCFLSDIREKAIDKHGLVQLQETLLSDILGEKDIKVGDVNRGIPIIKRRLQQKKILLILDDVDKLVQLKVLAGGYDWFGSGSKIIITTRDKQLLATHGVVKLHEVKQLDAEKACELFSWHAFKKNKVDPSYVHILNRAVFYACGLPLALEVIGSHLFGKSLDECNSALEKYERIPHKEILDILKVSYDGLEENEKGIFLDIACFLNTYNMGFVKQMLHAHGFHAEDGIRVLADKSLIKIDNSDCVRIHDLIQDMGREIVRQESVLEPSKGSRLWFDEDIVRVLEENMGTDKIEVVMLKVHGKKEVRWSGKAFKKMKNLKILVIGHAIFSTGPRYLPNSLRLLDWISYPSPSLPSDFYAKELEILHLPQSCLEFFQPLKRFVSLLSLKFEDCKFLAELPSLCEVPFLTHLSLDNCTNLVKVHDSVGFLDNLLFFSAKGCTQLEILVPCIKLASLVFLDLTGCLRLKSFPEVLGQMDQLKDIYLDKTGIDKLPHSIGNLVRLERLYLRQCSWLYQLPSSIHRLPNVEVITNYDQRGFQLFEGYYEDKEEVISEISPSTMVDYNNGMFIYLDLCFPYISLNNLIEVCSPNPREYRNFGFLFALLQAGGLNRYKYKPGSRTSSIHFWFRKKFPKIALCFSVEAYINRIWWVLDLEFSVFINGTKQFSSSCNYITGTWNKILWCDLQCKDEGVFSKHEWNQVEILSEVKYPTPCGERVMAAARNTIGSLNWSLIYVYEEGTSMGDVVLKNPKLHFPHFGIKPISRLPGCLYYQVV